MAHFAIAPMALDVKHHHHQQHTSHFVSQPAHASISPSPTILSHTQLTHAQGKVREVQHAAVREERQPSPGSAQRKIRKEDSGEGHTSFLRAARAGHLDKITEHLKNNVDINTSNANGLNALHLASKDGHLHVVTELLTRGANVDSATKKGNTALHIASLAGQYEVVKQLVENGASVNVQSQNGFTPLYMAAQENHDEVVRYLLDHGANQSLSTEDGFTPLAVAMQQGHDKVVAVLLENDTRGKVRLPALHIAAKKDDTKAAKLLLENDHNPDVTSKSGFTPLHIASHYGNEAVANILLDKRADVNFSAKHNITPLHVAAKWGKANMVTVLLTRGANIDNKTRDGLTALHCAARSGHEAVIEQLLEHGAPISSKTKNGLAPLHMAAQGDHVDTARVLLFHKAPVDDVTVDYLTALHVAAHCGHARVAKTLLDKKADPNARALNGFTPLHIACKKNRIKVVELLLKHGASIEATTESGLTPLHVASFMGCMNIVIYLLQNEASPDIPTVRGETPLHLAARANQTDIIRILLRNGAQVDARAREQQTPLHIASRLGNVDIVMLLLQHGAVVDATTKDLYTALHIAAKEGQEEVAAVLLENGASLTSTTKKGFTPLHLTGKYGHIKVAKLLLQKDAPVDFQGKNGVTPLHVASHYDHQNVALLLLEKGASVHATAKNGHTPLHIAAKKNQMDIATTLLEYGAKSNAESLAGFTPLHLSASEGHADMSAMLIEHEASVNHAAKNGLTPLHLCAQEDRVAVSEILLKNGAEVDAPTIKGFTPLHIACHYGQISMVRLLLDHGAKVSSTTDQGFTPLHHSAQQGHSTIVALLLDKGASPNATNKEGHTALSIAQKLGYISVEESLKGVTETLIIAKGDGEKHKVAAPEIMQETFMSDSEDENGEDTVLNDQPYRYLTVDEMKSLGDDSLPIDVTRDERTEAQVLSAPPTADHDSISPLHASYTLNLTNVAAPDNVDIGKAPMSFGKLHWRNFLVSFLVDARGGAMRGCRHSGVRLIVPPRRAAAPTRVTCRYLRKDKLPHPPPLMEGEALASRILELGPVGAKFLGPVMIEVPHFASLRGAEREIVILRSDNGEAWREHTVEASEEVVQEILSHSFEKEDMPPPVEADPTRLTRILTLDFPHYFAVVSRVKQEVHAIGPEGGMVSSSVVPQVQAVFPQGALTKKIKVGLQAQPIPTDITAKLLGNRVAVSPIVTIEPRRRKFHKPITLTIPVPQAANKGMINQYSGDAPTLRLLCSITGGTARAQWEDVTGTTPLTFVKDCVSFTTTVSARFWLMDCRNVQDSAKMATELYREAIHVPFLAKFVVFAKRIEQLEARLRVFCMTDDKEEKTLEQQEHFTEVAKSRDVEVLEGKSQFVEFAGNLVPVTKSGDQLRLGFRAFRENRLPFTVRVKDPHADVIGRTLFMREPKVSKGEAPQQPICVLNIVLPEEIIPETIVPDSELTRYQYLTHSSGLESYERTELRLSDISKLLENDWIPLASNLGISNSDICRIETDHPGNEAQQAMAMLKLWMKQSSNRPSAATLESALVNIGREDIIQKCIHSSDASSDPSSLVQRDYPDSSSSPFRTTEFVQVPRAYCTNIKDEESDRKLLDQEDLTYEIKESNIIEEPSKPVAEHRREIEKRLSQERSFSLEKPEKKSEELKMRTKKTEHITLTETEAKDEPELSFHDKRLSFERGSSQERAKTDVFIQEEKKSSIITSLPLDTAEVKVDEAAKLSFREKRKSFEQGSLDKPEKDDKKPKYVDGKISEIRDDVRKIQTVSETIETIGDKESIVSENVTKITGKSDKKPLTTERVTTTTQVVSEEKPITSKSIEEKNIVTISGAKDTSENPVSKTLVNEVVGTSLERDPKYDMKAKVETSKTVNETITTVNTDSKPLDEITVSVGSPKEKSAVSEIVTTLISGDNITKEIINIEINKEKPVISETITTVISDSKPIVENIKDTPIIKSKKTVIPDIEPGTDTKAFTEVITSVTTDKGPFEQAKAMTENLFKTEPKETEPIVLSSTKTGDDSRTITNTVRESVIVKTDGKPSDPTQIILETTKPYSSEKIDTIKGDNKLLVSETIKSVTETGKPTEEIKTNLHKGLEQAVKEQIMAKEVEGKDFIEEISNTMPQQFLKDEISTTIESNIISEIVTTKNIKGTPSEIKTVTEITRKSSDITKPDQQTIITEISAGKPDMSLEERRKSELFEGVTQGLLANVKYQEPNSKDIISPKLINTPPPSPADFKDATSVSSTTEPSWTSSTTLTDKTAIFIESERGPKPTGKSLQDSHEESKAPTSILKNNSECSPVLTEMRQEPRELSLDNILKKSFDLTTDNLSDVDKESPDYKKRKEFWEQLSSTASSIEKEVPTPKPRSSISSVKSISIDGDTLCSDIDRTKTLVISPEVHTKEILHSKEDLPLVKSTSAPTTTTHVVQETTRNMFSRENTRGESLDSEMEYIAKHPDSLAFENSCFTYEDDDETLLQSARMYDKRYSECLNEIPPIPCPRKTILERSTSLPCADLKTKESQVKEKKKFFEAQMRKETAVEQLEEEGSPERKSISLDQSLASPDQEALLNRQIHSHIFTNEMDEQIDSLVPEEKIISQSADIKRLTEFFESRSIESKESLEKTDSQESTDDPPRSKIAEVMLYKSESISKPSDSLEVQIDKSDVDSTMKEEDLDEDIREIEHELQKNTTEESRNRYSKKYPVIGEQTMLTKDNIALVSSAKSVDDSFTDNDYLYLEQNYKPEEKISQLISDFKTPESTHSTIHTPEEHIPDTVWEVGVQSSGTDDTFVNAMPPLSVGKEIFIDNEEEYAEEFSFSKPVTIEKENFVDTENDNILKNKYMSVTRDVEADDLTYSDTIESQVTEQFDLNSLTKEEARNIAESVVEEIEQELVKRKDIMAHIEDQVFSSTIPVTNISDTYLKEFAEKENMDIKLIESVLAKKQRDQYKKLARNDTATSSMEITDEDLRSSGLETDITGESLAFRMSGIIETDDEEDDLPKLEQSWTDDYDDSDKSKEYIKETTETKFETTTKPTEIKEFDYRRTEEDKEDAKSARVSYEASIYEQSFGHEDLLRHKKESSITSEKDNNLFRKDIVNTDLLKNEISQSNIDVHEKLKKTDGGVYIEDQKEGSSTQIKKEREEKSEKIIDERSDTIDFSEIKNQHDISKDWKSEINEVFEVNSKLQKESDTETFSKVNTKSRKATTDEGETSYKTKKERIIDTGTLKVITSSNEETSHLEKSRKTEILDHSRTESKIEIRKEYLGDASMIEELEKAGFRISEDIREETSRLVKSEIINKEKNIFSKKDYFVKDMKNIETVDTNDTDDTKSSSTETTVVSTKQPGTAKTSENEFSQLGKEDNMKSPSSVDIESTIEQEVTIRKHDNTSNKADRKSGADYDQLSSSDGSHYHSSEQISEKSSKPSRPCSTDVDALIATGGGGSSEYESAISHVSGKTSQTTNEYQTAASSLSSRESMKSLDSESSGNLASMSETLIPSASDLDQDMDIDSIPEDKCSYQQILEPNDTDILAHKIRGGFPHIPHSSSQPFKSEAHVRPTLTKSHTDGTLEQPSCQMKRSPEIALVTDNSPISESLDEKCSSSLDDGVSISASDITGMRTVIELSKTESERMEGSATSDQHSLTISATSGELSLSSESRDENNAANDPNDRTMRSFDDSNLRVIRTTSTDDGSLISGQIISHNAEHLVESDIKKKYGHKRNESQSFHSMIPVLTGQKKSSTEDVAESDKYDIKESEIDETDSEADQGLCRDIKEAHILKQALFEEEKSRSTLPSYSSDDYNEEILNQLISADTHMTVEEIILRPKTPEPPDDLAGHFKTSFLTNRDNLSTCSSSDVFVCDIVSSVTERHHSSASDHEDEFAEAEAAFHMVPHISPAIPTHLPPTIPEDPFEENKELETRESLLKEATMRKLAQADISPSFIPDITVTEHLTPLVDKDFKYPDLDLEAELAKQAVTTDNPASISTVILSETFTNQGQDYIPPELEKNGITSKSLDTLTKDKENEVDSPTSDSFEILETPDEMDEFVIVEEVAKEAEEKDNEGKSVQISKKRSVNKFDDDIIISPPKQPKTKMIKVEYYGENLEQGDDIGPFHLEDSPEKTLDQKRAQTSEDSSQESSPPTDDEQMYDKDAEARRKWIEMQFQGDPTVAAAYGYEMEFERGPLEDIKEEELTELETSSKFGSVSSQVSQSIGSIGSVGKFSLSSTPDFDILAGKKFFMRAGSEQDNVSVSSLQEFERLEQLMALESMKARSSGSQDSMNSSGRSTSSAKKSSNSGGELTSSSLKEFEGLERACIEAEKIEHKARAEELLLIEEGHESLTSESSSCVTITGPAKVDVDSDSENYEKRMFAIEEIIREAQSNVEQFADIKTESIGRGDSLEEVARIPDLEFDQPSGIKKEPKMKESEDEMVTSTDSLELKTAISRKELTTSTDSLEMKTNTGDPMSASTDSIEYHLKQKKDSKTRDFMKDSIEGTLPSLEDKLKYSDFAEDQSSSSGKDGDLSSSGKEEASGEINRVPPPRSEQDLGSNDSIDPTSSTATHATYQYETDSLMSSSFTSGGSNTLMSSIETLDNVTRTGVWFEDGRPYVTEVVEPLSDEEFSQTIHRIVELPPEVHKVTFSGPNAEEALKEYVEKFGPGEDVSETKEIDSEGNIHIKRVVQRRVVIKPEELSTSDGQIFTSDLEDYRKENQGQEQRQKPEYYEFDQDITESITSFPYKSNPTKSPTSSSQGLITELENRDEPSSSQGSRQKKEESPELDIKESNDVPKKK